MYLKELISTLDEKQPFAILKDENVLWMGNAAQLSASNVRDTLPSLLVKDTQLPSNTYNTYYGGASQKWNGLIITI